MSAIGSYAGGHECPCCDESVGVTDWYCRRCGTRLRANRALYAIALASTSLRDMLEGRGPDVADDAVRAELVAARHRLTYAHYALEHGEAASARTWLAHALEALNEATLLASGRGASNGVLVPLRHAWQRAMAADSEAFR